MSSTHSHQQGHGAPAGEDGINTRLIVAVGVVSLVIFALSTVVAAVILKRDEAAYAERGVAGPGKYVGQDEIGLIDQAHFDTDNRLEKWKATTQKRLQSYGWVDRKKNVIHIPIEEAMKQVVRQAGQGAEGAR